MATPKNEYFASVVGYVLQMQPGEWYYLEKFIGTELVPVPEALPYFVAALKRIIELKIDWNLFEGNIYFNDDESKIYKNM